MPQLTIPTLLTLARIIMLPVMVLLFYLPFSWSGPATAFVFVLASITDWFDGFLARLLRQESSFGAFLDPVADKLMVGTVLVLVVEEFSSAWMTIPAVIIIGREIAVSALREWMAQVGNSGRVAVSWIGKVKTTVQMIALILLLYRQPVFGLDILPIGVLALMIAAVLTLWSMIDYLRAAFLVDSPDAEDDNTQMSRE